MAKKRKKKRGRKKIVLFVFEILVLIIVLAVLGLYNSTIGKIDFKNDLSASEAGINDDIDEESVQTMHGYLNVAYSDSIIVRVVNMKVVIQTV